MQSQLSYETVALRRTKARLPESLHGKIDAILERATNVLSLIHPHVYFPVYDHYSAGVGLRSWNSTRKTYGAPPIKRQSAGLMEAA